MSHVVRSRRRPLLAAGLLAPLALVAMPLRAADDRVTQTGLISDDPAAASHVDPSLLDAWGVAFVPGGYGYVVKHGAGGAAAYDGLGIPQPYGFSIPGPAAGGPSSPTAVVANSTPSFAESGGSYPAALIVVGEDGVVSAWNLAVDGGAARRMVDNSASGASYKGVAIASDGAANFLYATDFHNGKVDVFDSNFNPVTSLGGFKDKTIPKNFAPFGIRNVGGVLYVTYARQDLDKKNDAPGKAQGFVNCFDANGFRLRRFATRGKLNSPSAMASAPADFGTLGGKLLVGNAGDGAIGVFDVETGRAVGALRGADGGALKIDGLRGFSFGNDVHQQSHAALFFASGADDGAHGLFGRLDPSGN